MSGAPILETERLVLHGHGLADLLDSAALWSDPEVVRHIGGRPSTLEEVWARLLRYAGHWALLDMGYWVVRERANGRFLGEAGFADARRALGPRFDGHPEAGWAFRPDAQGQGFAREAVAAVLAWGEARFAGRRTVCMIEPDNLASIRLAERLGYVLYEPAVYHGEAVLLFERGERR